MTGFRLPILLLGMAALTASYPDGATAAVPTANAQASAGIIRPLRVTLKDDLQFGDLAVGTAGTATINPSTGLMTLTGGLTRLGGTVSPARFIAATGSRWTLVWIRIPTGTITLRRVGGTETLTLTNITQDGNAIRVIPQTRVFEFAVGGRLNVPANALEGLYSAELPVTVDYF